MHEVDEIVAKADVEAVEGFGSAVQQAGQSTGDKKGMWQDSDFEDLVQYNDGFKTNLIGTPEQIADDLGISIKTVEAHRANIMEKLNVNTVADLLRLALSNKPQPAQ